MVEYLSVTERCHSEIGSGNAQSAVVVCSCIKLFAGFKIGRLMSQLNIDKTIAQGGESLVELLKYCVFCRELDPLFLMLARNYQMLPDAAKALAIYSTFLKQQSPLQISGEIPARRGDALLMQSISTIEDTNRRILEQQTIELDEEEEPDVITPFLPAKYLFDTSVAIVKVNSRQIGRIEREYDPTLGAFGNLPDRKLSTVQLTFIEHRWKPARAALSGAGFFMVANIGD